MASNDEAERRLLDMLVGWERWCDKEGYEEEMNAIAELYQEAGQLDKRRHRRVREDQGATTSPEWTCKMSLTLDIVITFLAPAVALLMVVVATLNVGVR